MSILKKAIVLAIVLILSVAVFAAMLVSCSTSLSVREVRESIDDSGMIWYSDNSGTRPGISLTLCGGGEGCLYAVTADDGSVKKFVYDENGSLKSRLDSTYFMFSDGDEVLWLDEYPCNDDYPYYLSTPELSPEKTVLFEGDKTYINVIVMSAERKIVGYAVIEITREKNPAESGKYTGRLLGQYEFPKKSGEYQDIGIEYVNEKLAELKKQ